jgi:hypothetical protein
MYVCISQKYLKHHDPRLTLYYKMFDFIDIQYGPQCRRVFDTITNSCPTSV